MSKHHNPFDRPFSPALALAISPNDILDFHRSTFGNLRMEDTGGDGSGDDGKDKDEADKTKPDPDDGKGKADGDADKLGDAGKRALTAEREARDKAEKETKALREQVDGFFGGLKTLLGADGDKGTKPEELIEKLNSKIDGLERANLVESVARRHKITDEDDLDMLRAAKDEDTMSKLAKRLAPSDEDQTDSKGKDGKRAPRADRSQGKGGDGTGSRASSVSQVIADRRAAREAKAK
jgi:hypothetical protein